MSDAASKLAELTPGQVVEGYRLVERVADGPFSDVWLAEGPSAPSLEASEEHEPASQAEDLSAAHPIAPARRSKNAKTPSPWAARKPAPRGPVPPLLLEEGDTRRVAIKFAKGALGERMLLEELELTGQLADAGCTAIVPSLRHVAAREGRPALLILPWVSGGTLRERLRAEPSPDERAALLAAFMDLLLGLERVHGAGVVHGDLKPENVVFDAQGHARLLDFGLARSVRETRLELSLRESLREDELAGGTLAYMAPETLKGGEPSRQADVYAMGVILHELLLGTRPDRAMTEAGLRSLLPAPTVAALLKALAYDPADRFYSAAHLHRALLPCAEALTAVGARRLQLRFVRFVRNGCAAFFVALRYFSVLAILATYVAVATASVSLYLLKGDAAPLIVAGVLAVGALALHATIRWEGPESAEESSARQLQRRLKPGKSSSPVVRAVRAFFGRP